MAGTSPDKPSHDQVETATSFALLLWGAHNPLIRRYFLGVFRFAKMALADARTWLTPTI
jgi:hypothetical protein